MPRPRKFFAWFLAAIGQPCRRFTGWAQHALATKLGLTPRPKPHPDREHAPTTPGELYWHTAKQSADTSASTLADRYRSSYVAIFALAALSVLTGAWAELAPPAPIIAGLELACLLGIFLLVIANHVANWQERWISRRVIAEFCRIQKALSSLGWSIGVDRLAPLRPGKDKPRDAWVGWYLSALMRAAPAPAGHITVEVKTDAIAAIRALAHGQIAYNRTRHASHHRAANRLIIASEALFGFTVLIVLIKFALHHHPETPGYPLLALLSTFLPALSAALFGVRAYAEFDMLAHQSIRTRQAIQNSLDRLTLVDPTRPLASQQIGAEMYAIAVALLGDTAGWAQIFRGKSIDAG